MVLLARPQRGSSPKGVSYGIVGALAIDLAATGGGKATSRQGALHTLAGSTLGKALLVLLAIGFAAYALWRVVQAVAEREDGDEAKERAQTWGKRAGYLGRAAIYGALTWSTIAILAGSGGGQSQNQKAHRTTATVFDWPAGRWLVAIAGVVVAGVGVWNLYRGLTRKFEDKWRSGEMSAAAQPVGSRVGLAGHAARFVVFALMGVFVDEGGARVRPEGGDRPRRRAPEARPRGLRAVAPRSDRGRAPLLRRVLPRRRPLPGRLRRLAEDSLARGRCTPVSAERPRISIRTGCLQDRQTAHLPWPATTDTEV